MSIHNYIEHQLIRKNLGTYFRNGKWVVHLVVVLAFMAGFVFRYSGHVQDWTVKKVLASISSLVPFLLFFYTYCLYIIPFYFKRNKFRQFWLLLLIMLVLSPLLDYWWQFLMAPVLPRLAEDIGNQSDWQSVSLAYLNFIGSFIAFTSMLYFMEVLEAINIHKETATNTSQLSATELHRIKTQMNPDFMIRSLDGIIQLADTQNPLAPDSVIDFSDVLRYRLYRSKEKLVPLEEELAQLTNLFRLHNTLPEQAGTCTLEVEGNREAAFIVPLSLINIVEPLLATFEAGAGWSLLMYHLIEEKEIQVAVELTTDNGARVEEQSERIHEDLQQLLYTGLNFTVEKEDNTYSLRTCIPIFRNSIASS